jgi:hypothetical protein
MIGQPEIVRQKVKPPDPDIGRSGGKCQTFLAFP